MWLIDRLIVTESLFKHLFFDGYCSKIFFEFERGLTKCFEIVVYLFHYSVMIFLCIYSLKKNIAHVGQGALKLYVFACYLKLFSLNQYYLVSHLTKNHTILRNHTNHYKIKPLPYHTIWGPPVEITFIILVFLYFNTKFFMKFLLWYPWKL